jgi:hypothetical protein
VVLVGAGKPIVLCAIDWIGLSNDGHLAFREGLAKGAETEVNRVAMHSLHQHDAPRCDFSAEALLNERGLHGAGFNPEHARKVIADAAEAVRKAIGEAQPVTHLGLGSGEVKEVASNRRILGEDGKVKHTRYTATADPEIRAFPAGTIDPILRAISFWNEEKAVAVLTYYATHPQSYYRTGMANPDFPGIARNIRQEATGVPHIHFNGAGGNIGAGKWNDGAVSNRQFLAERVAAGMAAAWNSTVKSPLASEEVGWVVEPVHLPLATHVKEDALLATLNDENTAPGERYMAAKILTWARRCAAKEPLDLSCLILNEARVLHMPGELFVEYQLGAQRIRPELFVAMAAYGDYAPGYICTDIAYTQGGYEASELASKVEPGVEAILMEAIRKLLETAPK